MIKVRELKRGDFKDFCRNEMSYSIELEEDPRFGIGTYGRKASKGFLAKRFSKLLKEVKSGKLIVLVAENDRGRVIGMAEARGNAWAEAPHIADIGYSVIKEYRRQGVGNALVKALIKRCRRKYEIATAGAFGSNTASRKLLTKLGFKIWGKGPGFVKRGRLYLDSELWYMRLDKKG